MRNGSWVFVAVSVLVAILAPSPGRALKCKNIKSMMYGEVYTAKIPLYDTMIGKDGVFRTEDDAEEIPEGAKFTVVRVICTNKKIVLRLRQKVEARLDSVKISLYLSAKQRKMPDAEEQLKKMMGHVMSQHSETAD